MKRKPADPYYDADMFRLAVGASDLTAATRTHDIAESWEFSECPVYWHLGEGVAP